MPKLSLRSRYSLILLAVAVGILALGIVFRPRKQQDTQPHPGADMFRLQTITQQQQLDDMAEFLSDAADRMSSRLIYLKRPPYTAVVRDDKAVTSGFAPDQPRTAPAVLPRGDVIEVERAAAPSGSIVQVLRLPASYRASPRPANAPQVSAGDWVLAVARGADRQPVFAQGLYQSTSAAQCGSFAYRAVYSSAPLSPALVGGGLFAMDGDLLGVIADCKGQPVVVDIQTVDALLRGPVPLNDRLADAYGFDVAEVPKGAGVQVVSVWDGGRAQQAGVRPGDLIAAADDKPVAAAADLAQLADDAAHTDHTLALFRGKKQVRVVLPSHLAEQIVDAPGGLRIGPGLTVRAVGFGSAAAMARIQQGDVITAVDGTTVSTIDEALKVISRRRGGPVLLGIRRGANTAQALLETR